MNGLKLTLAIAWREFLDRKIVFGLALVCAVIPFLAPVALWLNGSVAHPFSGDVKGIISSLTLVLGTILAMGIAGTVGFTLFARDFAERRAGFFFSRPISGGTIWTAKVLAGIGSIVVAFVGTVSPAFVSGYFEPLTVFTFSERVVGIVCVAIVGALFAIGLYAGIAFRSKSKWLLVDLVLAPVAVVLAGTTLPAIVLCAPSHFLVAAGGLVGLAVLGAFAASAVGVRVGRTDIKAAHRAMVPVLWGTILCGVVGIEGYARWLYAVTPDDLVSVDLVTAAPRGTWTTVSGRSNRGETEFPLFVVDSASGRWLPGTAYVVDEVAFSGDGKHAAWLEWDGSRWGLLSQAWKKVTPSQPTPSDEPRYATLVLADLSGSTPTVVRTNALFPWNSSIVLSDGGSRAAVWDGNQVTFFDCVSRAQIRQTMSPLLTARPAWRGFVSNDVFRLYGCYSGEESNSSPLCLIAEFDLRTKEWSKPGRIEGFGRYGDGLLLDPAGQKILTLRTVEAGEPKENVVVEATLRDGRGGNAVTTLATAMPDSERVIESGWFLADGRIALCESDTSGVSFRLFGPDGAEQRTIRLDRRRRNGNCIWNRERFSFSGETAPGRSVVVADVCGEGSGLFVVDFNTGAVTERRVSDFPWTRVYLSSWWNSPWSHTAPALTFYREATASPENESRRKFSLVSFNPETGEKRTIIQAKP